MIAQKPPWPAVLVCFLVLSFAAPVAAQTVHVEIDLAVGGSLLDAEDVVLEQFGGNATDWDQIMYRVAARLMVDSPTGISFGGEVGFTRLFWYEERVPDPNFTIFRDFNVDPFYVAGLVRFGDAVLIDVGGAAYFIENGPEFGALVAVGKDFSVSPALTIPVKLRADVVLTNGTPVIPVGISAGVKFALGG